MKQKKYINITEAENNIRKAREYNKFKTFKIPYKKSVMVLCGIIVVISLCTPFTNVLLIPLSIKLFRRFA